MGPSGSSGTGQVVGRVLIGGYLLLLAAVAFWPTPVDRGAQGAIRRAVAFLREHGLPWLEYAHVEWAANVALYVPLGVIGMLLLRRWWLATLLGVVVSVAVELIQGLLLPERFSTSADVAANALGTLLGAVATSVLLRISGGAAQRPRYFNRSRKNRR